MSDGQNEVIIGQLHYEQHQPDIFEAVVYLAEESEAHARRVHARFLEHFGLQSDQLPIVRYDWHTKTFHDMSQSAA